MLAIGVDGCRGGWFWTTVEGSRMNFGVAPNLADLLGATRADRILIDIPIGLTSREGGKRVCDSLARKRLGRRASSVFTPPCREAIAERTYVSACDVNERITGKRLSRQCWGIVPKIREVDLVMRSDDDARGRVRESHPELCFAALAAGEPMRFNKKTGDGYRERVALLNSVCSKASREIERGLSETKRSVVARDDIVDAVLLAIVAAMPAESLRSLTGEPARDACGLPMEMVYPVSVRG